MKTKSVNVLWMIDSYTRLTKGKVLKSKDGKEVANVLETEWIHVFGRPKVGFWSDNGTEFINKDLEALCQKWGISLKPGPPIPLGATVSMRGTMQSVT